MKIKLWNHMGKNFIKKNRKDEEEDSPQRLPFNDQNKQEI